MVKQHLSGRKGKGVPSEEILNDYVMQLKELIELQKKAEMFEHSFKDKIIYFKKLLDHVDRKILLLLKGTHKKAFEAYFKKYLKEQAYPIVEELVSLSQESSYQLHIMREEGRFADMLSKDLKHRRWRAVFREIKKEEVLESMEEKEIRLDVQSLKVMHDYFRQLREVIGKTKQIEQDLETGKIKLESKTKNEIEIQLIKIIYFLTDLYDFSKAYELLFRDLLEKERILLKSEESKTRILEAQIKARKKDGKAHS